MKRLFDICVSIILLLGLALPLAVLGLCQLCLLGRPVFFTQERAGRDGRAFRIIKFRSMRTGDGSDAERLTGWGKFLRSTSLDELPELWNVLRGEMSFVGPRPVMQDELDEHYGSARTAYCAGRPGITGLWQVLGRNDLSYAERVELDIDYTRRMGFGLDVWIILRTAGVVVRPTGR